jgi:hypothetical protein
MASASRSAAKRSWATCCGRGAWTPPADEAAASREAAAERVYTVMAAAPALHRQMLDAMR